MTVLLATPPPQLTEFLSRPAPSPDGTHCALADGHARMSLASGTSAAAEARAVLEQALEGRPRRAVADALIVVSELVTNSVLHADLAPGDLIEMRADAGGSTLTIYVVDWGPGFEPNSNRPVDFATPGGNGLPLVDMISTRWGVTRDPSGVWAQLPC
jgi:anti-sigma regulatory factor (Ser/Thr protein kinase)